MTKDKTINVLYVDDEIHNLEPFTATFRRYFKVFTALSAKEAEILLENHEIHVLVTDQRMPVKTGTELLAEAVKKYPHQVRILLTAFADTTVIKDAKIRGQIFCYLEKPWKEHELKKAIIMGYEAYTWKRETENLKKELELRKNEINSVAKQKRKSE